MTKQNYSHIVALIDRSGSMKLIEKDVIGGFSTFIDEQKLVPGEATITLVQFNDQCHTTYSDVPLSHVAHLTAETYKPSGWTALNDAFAQTIDDVGRKLAAKPEHERPSRVIFLVMTDGQENTSKKFGGHLGQKLLSDMVVHQREKYNWNFSFIGANIDSFATAERYGILTTSTINYTSDAAGQFNAFKSLSRGVVQSRMKTDLSMTDAFFANDTNSQSVENKVLDHSNIAETIAKYTTAPTQHITPPTPTSSTETK